MLTLVRYRAKYQPYDALRQKFWRVYLKQYDTDDTGTISHLELTSMLDSLGSTLSHETVNSFWTRFNKRPHDEVLTIDEAIQCLETELCRPASEKKRIDPEDSVMDTSAPVTPAITGGMETQQQVNFDKLDFSGAPHNSAAMSNLGRDRADGAELPAAPAPQPTEPMQMPLREAALGTSVSSSSMSTSPSQSQLAPPGMRTPSFNRNNSSSTSTSDAEDSSGSNGSNGGGSPEASFERVINVKNCPLCHRPRLNSKAEVDIVTHLAVCASQDWARVDRIVVGNYVTASQAQRKWYTKVISKVSSGNYKLGAVSDAFGWMRRETDADGLLAV